MHLPIKSSGQPNRKKPAIVCRVLARLRRCDFCRERAYSTGEDDAKRHFAACLFRARNLFPTRSATSALRLRTTFIIEYICVDDPWSGQEKCIPFVVRIIKRIVGFQEGLTVKTIPSSLDVLSIALFVRRC